MTPEFAHQFVVQQGLSVSKQAEEKAIYEMIAKHIDALVYNVASVSAVMTLLHGVKKVTKEHLVDVRNYIESKCPMVGARSKQEGGVTPYWPGQAAMAVSSESNADGHFYNPLAEGATRPALGPDPAVRMTGGSKDRKMVAMIKRVLKQHNLSISKDALEELLEIIESHMGCMAEDLRRVSPLTVSKIERIFALKRHAVFN